MKLLFTIQNMGAGGAEKVISILSNYLSRQNIEIRILTTSKEELCVFYDIDKRVKVVSLFKEYVIKKKMDKINCIAKYISSYKPDCVISFLDHVIFYTYFACKKTKTKLIVSERNNPYKVPSNPILRLVRNYIFRHASGCVFQTNDAMKYFKERFNRGVVIPNPVTEFKDYLCCQRKNNILVVGSDKKEKNRVLFYKAFSIFLKNKHNFQAIIVGENSFEKDKQTLDELNITDSIKFVGKDNKWQDKYYDSAMFVLPSDFEGMPNALLEAASIGIPCISTDCPIGGSKDILNNGEFGILTEVGNAEKMAQAMVSLSEDQTLVNKFSSASKIVKEKYSVNNICNKWLVFINDILTND